MMTMKEKMGKIIAGFAFIIATGILLAVMFFLFNVTITGFNYAAEAAAESRFVTLSYEGSYSIVYDKETMIQYALSNGSYNRGTLVMLVDKDGKPLIYEGGK